MKCTVFACAFLLFAANASADTIASIGQYQRYKTAKDENWKAMIVYITGMAEAFDWANAYLLMNSRTPLYCPPERLHFNAQLLTGIIDDEIANERVSKGRIGPLTDDDKLEPLFMYGLIHTFPCNK
jgi:hypothetical protein